MFIVENLENPESQQEVSKDQPQFQHLEVVAMEGLLATRSTGLVLMLVTCWFL